MSYVFLAGERVYKLKKPVRFAFLDFSTISAREADCREELRLNRRLAPGVYLDVVPLTLAPSGELAMRGEGEIVDWLVEMRRLPAALMLDRLIAEGGLEARTGSTRSRADARRTFTRAPRARRSTPARLCRAFLPRACGERRVLARDAAGLRSTQFWPRASGRCSHRARSIVSTRSCAASRRRSSSACAQGRVVDGHGDLRPEHICFCEPIAIFDCLEFNRRSASGRSLRRARFSRHGMRAARRRRSAGRGSWRRRRRGSATRRRRRWSRSMAPAARRCARGSRSPISSIRIRARQRNGRRSPPAICSSPRRAWPRSAETMRRSSTSPRAHERASAPLMVTG